MLKKLLNQGSGDVPPEKMQKYVKIIKEKLYKAAVDGSLMKLTNTPRTQATLTDKMSERITGKLRDSELSSVQKVSKLPLLATKEHRPKTNATNRRSEKLIGELKIHKLKSYKQLNSEKLRHQSKQLELLMNKTMKWVVTQEFQKYSKEDMLEHGNFKNSNR